MSDFPSLAEIVHADATAGWKADRCLEAVSSLPWDDLAKPELLAAAKVYASLEIASAIDGLTNGVSRV